MSITRRRSLAATDGDSTRPTGYGRARAWHRIGRGALVVAAGTAALALAGPMALRPFVDAAQAAGAAGEVTVAFAIDFGGGSAPVKGCVQVPPTDNGYQALGAFLAQMGMAGPTFNSSGLLCSIDAVPTNGCGQPVNGQYIYWSYFTGTGSSWAYADTGAFAPMTQGSVQGWRFQNPGTGRPNDPPPRVTAQFTSLCASSPSGGSPGGAGSSPSHRPGGGGGARKPKVAKKVTGGAAARTTGAPKRSTKTSGSTTTTSTYPPDTTTTVADIPVPPNPEVGLANARHASSGGGSGPGPDPLIIGGLVVAALAVAAYARWRKRTGTP